MSQGIPTAVAPSILGPGSYLSVDLLAGPPAAGAQALKGLVIAPCSSAGDLTPNTEIRLAGSTDDAADGFGPGTPGHLAMKQLIAQAPAIPFYMMAPTASAGAAAAGSLTFSCSSSTVATTYNIKITIAGREVNVPWLAGETPDNAKTRVMSYIGRLTQDLPVAATSGGTGIVTITCKVVGPMGNDVTLECVLESGAGGSVAVSGAKLTGGTTEVDLTSCIATLAVPGRKFDFILLCLSNADTVSASTSNPSRMATSIGTQNHGLNAKLQRVVLAATGAVASTQAGAVARNDPTFEFLHCENGRSLPCEWAAFEMGSRMQAISIDPAANRIGTECSGLYGSANIGADTPGQSTIEAALASGVSIVSYNAQGKPIIVRPITAHSQDASGNSDLRVLDTSGVDGVYAVANDVMVGLPQAFPRAKLCKNIAAGDEPPPPGVVEERDVFAYVVTLLRYWQGKAVVRKDVLDSVVSAGEAIQNGMVPAAAPWGALIVQVDPSDESQCNIVIPTAIYKPLAKFSTVVEKVA